MTARSSLEFSGYDHTFLELGRLGDGVSGTLLGGDVGTWGEGAYSIGEIQKFSPTDQVGETYIFVKRLYLKFHDFDEISYTEISHLLNSEFDKITEQETDFVLWILTEFFGEEDFGVISPHCIDEWAVDDLKNHIEGSLKGKLIIHSNTRVNARTAISNEGECAWLDDVDPSDDLQVLAIGF